MTFDDIIAGILVNEGGYVNDPADRGGETMYGITAATARQQGYAGPMRDLPRSFATEVYRRRYIIAPGFDKVAALSMPIAAELVDTGVNMGVVVAGRFLQRALNGLGDGGLLVDGNCGPTTLAALKAFLDKRAVLGEKRLIALLNALQGVRYLDLVEANRSQKTFLFGWLGRITP